jgi:hypothetical protein
MDSGGIVFKVAIFALIGLSLYYFYKWLNGSADLSNVILFSSATDALPANSTTTVRFTPDNSDIPALFAGGEYSISTWIYITSWGVNKGRNKPFLYLSGGGGATGGFYTTVMYLGQNYPKLGIRTSTPVDSPSGAGPGGAAGAAAGRGSGTATLTTTGVSLTTTQMNLLIPPNKSNPGQAPYTDAGGDFGLCDIESVDLQRWVNITVVLNGRTQDVYIDGKMSRSCVLPGVFTVDSDTPTLQLGGPSGFGGLIGTTRAANFAYSPDQVYKYYQDGPLDTSIWTKIKSLVDPSQYSFSAKKNGSNLTK